MHPGTAKGKMVNSQKVATHFLSLLPKDRLSPETTEGREGFVHVSSSNGNEELTTLNFIIRDFGFLNQLPCCIVNGNNFAFNVLGSFKINFGGIE